MPNNILSSLFSKSALVITNTTNATVVAKNLKVRKVSIKLTSKVMRHQQEDGSTIVDSKILMPLRLDIESFVPDIDTLTQVNQIILDRESIYTLSSKGLVMSHMMAEGTNLKQGSEMLSATPARITFKQLLVKDITPVICKQSGDSSIIDRGIAALEDAKQTVTDMVNKVGNAVNDFVGSL